MKTTWTLNKISFFGRSPMHRMFRFLLEEGCRIDQAGSEPEQLHALGVEADIKGIPQRVAPDGVEVDVNERDRDGVVSGV